VADHSKQALVGDILLAVLDDEFTIKTLARKNDGAPGLLSANQDYSAIEVTEEMSFEI
jgi:DNA polymerase V